MLERLAATGSLPVRQQFCLVQPTPFKHKAKSSWLQRSLQHDGPFDADRYLLPPVNGMEVRHTVLGVEHCDDDAVEAGDLGQVAPAPAASAMPNECSSISTLFAALLLQSWQSLQRVTAETVEESAALRARRGRKCL